MYLCLHLSKVSILDLESLVYVIIYLVKGRLPWQGIIVQPGRIREDEVLKVKQTTTLKTLCEGLPRPFITFIKHIQHLGFRDKPNYNYLRSVLENCAQSQTLPDSTDVSFVHEETKVRLPNYPLIQTNVVIRFVINLPWS